MKPVTLLVIAVALAASLKALALETPPLTLKVPKSALAAAPAPSQSNAPFAVPMGTPELSLSAPRELHQEPSPSACSKLATLCYDAEDRRIVFKPARNYMPDLPGFTRENISVRRDRVVFRYSF